MESQAFGSQRGDEFIGLNLPYKLVVVGRETVELMRCAQAISWSKVNVTKEIKVGFG